MHSRIFQISKEPIDKADYIDSGYYDYDHWFTNSVADYVSDDCNRDADIEWLKSCAKGLIFDKDNYGDYFVVKNKEDYFESKFKTFQTSLDKIKECTIEDFSNGMLGIWSLKNAYEEKFGFYVDVDGEVISFDSFVRCFAVNEKWYVGNTLDYHC